MSDPADPSAARLPSQAYAAGAARGDWQDDPAQHPALAELKAWYQAHLPKLFATQEAPAEASAEAEPEAETGAPATSPPEEP